MSIKELSNRIAKLEREVAELRSAAPTARNDWWERPGAFVGDRLYAEATRLGRAYRLAQRPKKKAGKKRDRT